MIYIRPKQTVQVKLFLLDSTGEYVDWKLRQTGRAQAFKLHLSRKFVTLSMVYHCREEAIGSIISHLQSLQLDTGYTVTFVPPSLSEVKLSTLNVTVGGSLDGNRINSQKTGIALFKKGYALSTTKRSHRQVYNLMDVVLGTVSMLMSGPGAYIRPKVGLNICNVGVSKKVKYRRYTLNESNYYSFSSYKNYETLVSESNLGYNGITNFYMDHPASFSVITGLFKNTLQMWFDNLYDKIDRKVGIAATKVKLSAMSRKKVLSKKDKEVLLSILDKLKPYLYGKRSEENPGAYPLNKYTHSMFLKYINISNKKGIMDTWQQKTGDSVYPSFCYGFASWCTSQVVQTPEYANRGHKDWGGLVGQYFSFAGHDR